MPAGAERLRITLTAGHQESQVDALVEALSRICAAKPTLMSHLYTEVRGNGPALVLLHGWGLNVRVWDGLAAALCDRFRIIAVDLPGHGRSVWLPERSSLEEQAAQVAETVAAITAEYSLLGWSLGGQIALQLAAAQCAAARDPSAAAPWTAWC